MEVDVNTNSSMVAEVKSEILETSQMDALGDSDNGIEKNVVKCEGCLGVEDLRSMLESPAESATENYVDLFKQCFNIEVGIRSISEGSPCLICVGCINELNNAYKFRQKVLTSQDTLSQHNYEKDENESESNDAGGTGEILIVEPLVFMVSEKTKEEKSKKFKKEKVEVKNESDNPKSDSEERKLSIYQRELNRIKLLYYKIEENSTKCNKCTARFKTHNRLLVHIKKHYKDHVCFKCHLTFKSSQAVNEHLKNVCMREFRYGCPNCDEGFMSDLSRKKHMKLVHNLDVEVFVCKQCGREFLNYHQMVTHVEGVHQKVRDRECPVCGKFYYNKRIHKHLKSHNTDRLCTCDVCGKSFGTVDTLKRHKKVHAPKEHICPCCGLEFTYKNSYKLHMSRYHPEFGEEKPSCAEIKLLPKFENSGSIDDDNNENESDDDEDDMNE